MKGSAIVEFVFGISVFTLLLTSIVSYNNFLLSRRRLLSAARFGTLTQSSGHVSADAARQSVFAYLARLSIPNAAVEVGRYQESPSSRFYQLAQTRITWRDARERVVVEAE